MTSSAASREAELSPIRLVDNSYWLSDRLGAGGMATVYRATYRLNGQQMALKLVSGEQFESSEDTISDSFRLRLALVREFQTLASLHHPNIVDVLGYGLSEGRDPYFTMELLEQPQDILQAATGQPLSIKLDLLAQVLRALTYVHRRGILHRDIKPSNVLCVSGKVKVLDFGIAVAATKIESLAGTLDYMAPELLKGQPPSIASDLYAVGLLAYQMLTGRYPFNRDSRTGFLRGLFHTRSDITISSTVANLIASASSGTVQDSEGAEPLELMSFEGLTDPVGEVVRRLLARDPADRFSDAPAVVQALAAASGEPLQAETADTRESFLQASEFVGREAEIDQLSAALEHAIAGQGAGFLLGGESGVGKSRLTSEVRTLALVSGAVVAQGQAVTESSSHYRLWLPVLKLLCLHVEMQDTDAAVLKALIPDLPDLLQRAIPDAPKIPSEFVERRLLDVIEKLFRKCPRPIVVLLEDLQWAGADSQALLNHLSALAGELRLLIVGTYRDDESPDLPQQLLHMQAMRLQRLDQNSIAQLSASMLGEVGRQAWVVDYLCKQSEGNVFFLIEVARVLAEQAGQLNGIGLTELPEQVFTLGIGRIVERRLEHVPAEYRPMLEAAATIGRKIDAPVLTALFPGTDLRTFLMICANASILDSDEGDWRFTHDKLREGLLDRLLPPQRQQLHAQVATVLEANYSNVESYYAVLAYHFRQGGQAGKASTYYLRAGESAMRLCAFNDARKHFAGAIEMLHSLPATDEIKRQMVDTLLKQVRAAHIADQPKQNLDRLAEATSLLDSLRNEQPVTADVLRLAWVYYWRGRIHYYSGESRVAIQLHQQVLDIARAHHHTELLMLASAACGTTLFTQGRVDLALPLVVSTINAFAATGYGSEWIRAVGHQGLCLVGLGQYERGLQEIDRAHARALEIDKPMIHAMTHLYYCMGSMHSGDWPVMLQRGHQALDAAKQCGEKIYQSLATGYLAWAENQLGRYDEALSHYQQLQERIAAMGGKLVLSILYDAVHAEVLLNTNQLDAAIERATAVATAARLDENCNALGMAERTWGVALHRRGGLPAGEVDAHLDASVRAFLTGGLALDAARTRRCWIQICRDREDHARAQKLTEDDI